MNNSLLSPKPEWVFIELNSVCNFRCKQCHIWTHKPHDSAELIPARKRVIQELADWPGSPTSNLIFCGGECFMNADEVFELSSFARARGLKTVALTNGSLLTEDLIARVFSEGPDTLSISIDAPRAGIHDRMRGVPGSFDLIVNNIRRILAHPSRRKIRIIINAILCKGTMPHALEHVEFLRALDVDNVFFLPLAPTVDNQRKTDVFFEAEARVPAEFVTRYLDPLLAIARKDSFVLNNQEDLEFIRRYFMSPDSVLGREVICDSASRRLMISDKGGVSFCNSMIPKFSKEHIGYIGDPECSLREIWNSSSSLQLRQEMLKCTDPCGLLSCHRKGAI